MSVLMLPSVSDASIPAECAGTSILLPSLLMDVYLLTLVPGLSSCFCTYHSYSCVCCGSIVQSLCIDAACPLYRDLRA